MEKKTDTVRRLTADGDFKGALRIAKDFRLGITKQESSAMKLAYECMVHGNFYKQLGYDLNEKVAEGLEVLKALYGRRSENDGLYQQV
jgi:hypothetical protein